MAQSLPKNPKILDISSPELSIIIPMRNEAENVAPLIKEIYAELSKKTDFEIVCIDDGSDDTTEFELRQIKITYPSLRVIQHHNCCGQSTAISTGIKAARGAWIVTLDGDGQNPPSEIPKLFHALKYNLKSNPTSVPLMIAGQREARKDSWFRRLCSIVANSLREIVLQDGIRDTGCSLKLFQREVFLNLPYFDHMHRFLPALIQRAGGQVIIVNVKHRPRLAGKTKYGLMNRLWTGLIDLIGVFWLIRRSKHPIINELD